MTQDEVRRRLAKSKRSEVAKATGLPYMYLYRVEREIIKNPGTRQTDILRSYFISRDIHDGRPQ